MRSGGRRCLWLRAGSRLCVLGGDLCSGFAGDHLDSFEEPDHGERVEGAIGFEFWGEELGVGFFVPGGEVCGGGGLSVLDFEVGVVEFGDEGGEDVFDGVGASEAWEVDVFADESVEVERLGLEETGEDVGLRNAFPCEGVGEGRFVVGEMDEGVGAGEGLEE